MTQVLNQQAQGSQPQPAFGIHRVFLKGQSLEMPQGAQTFGANEPVDATVNIQVSNAPVAPGVFEVSIRATLTAAIKTKPLYLLEVEQSGIFEAHNFDAAGMFQILEATAPTILMPYLRAQITDTLAKATLPGFYLPEINMHAMAEKKRQELAEVQASPSAVLH